MPPVSQKTPTTRASRATVCTWCRRQSTPATIDSTDRTTYTVRLPERAGSWPNAVTRRATPATSSCRPMMIATTRVVSSGQASITTPAATVRTPKPNGHSHDLPTPARRSSGSPEAGADFSGAVMASSLGACPGAGRPTGATDSDRPAGSSGAGGAGRPRPGPASFVPSIVAGTRATATAPPCTAPAGPPRLVGALHGAPGGAKLETGARRAGIVRRTPARSPPPSRERPGRGAPVSGVGCPPEPPPATRAAM